MLKRTFVLLLALSLWLSQPGVALACSSVSGSLTNALDGGPYLPDCATAIAVHIPSGAVYPGTCSGSSTYSITTGSEATGFYVVIITWNPGPNGTPSNQPASISVLAAGAAACPGNTVVAQSGPLAVTIDSFDASSEAGRWIWVPTALFGLVLVGALRKRRDRSVA